MSQFRYDVAWGRCAVSILSWNSRSCKAIGSNFATVCLTFKIWNWRNWSLKLVKVVVACFITLGNKIRGAQLLCFSRDCARKPSQLEKHDTVKPIDIENWYNELALYTNFWKPLLKCYVFCTWYIKLPPSILWGILNFPAASGHAFFMLSWHRFGSNWIKTG